MKTPAFLALIAILPISSCRKPPAEVTVTETRALTSKDVAPKLFATSDQRFRDAKPSPVKAETPEGWLAMPATQMRLLNYRFGSLVAVAIMMLTTVGMVVFFWRRGWLKRWH
jgi:hypothetical protein